MAHFDPSDDFSRLIDRLEPVRLVRRGESGDGEPLLALRRPIAESQSQENHADTAWLFSAADVSQPPCIGDAIVDAAGVRHAVLNVQGEGLGMRFRCATRVVAESQEAETVELLQAIRERWAGSPTLCALLSESRLFSDRNAEGIVPSAQLTQESCKPLMRYGDGTRVEETFVRIAIRTASTGEATSIRNEAALVLDCCGFPLSGGGRVLDMQLAGETRRREHDSPCVVTLDFRCIVLVPCGSL